MHEQESANKTERNQPNVLIMCVWETVKVKMARAKKESIINVCFVALCACFQVSECARDCVDSVR